MTARKTAAATKAAPSSKAETPAETPATETPAETPAEETPAETPTEAPAETPTEAPAEEATASADEPADEPAKDDEDAKDDEEQAAPPAPPVPATAVLTPPPPPADPTPVHEEVSASLADAAAERLRVTDSTIVIRTMDGQKVDPETLFSAPDELGERRCLQRITQHATATVHHRPVVTLLLAKGQSVHRDVATSVLDTIRAED